MPSLSSPIVADIRIKIKEVTTTEKCDDNCAECREAAKTRAYNRSQRRRKAYKVKRRERRLAEKSRLEKAELDLELEANSQPGGSREGTKSRKARASDKYTSKSQPSIPANQREGANESNMSSTATLPLHIFEVVTIDSSSESEDESEFIRVLRKFGSFY